MAKKTTTTTNTPTLDRAKATAVEPYRHDATARTVAFHQAADSGEVHLFSATGVHVATKKGRKVAETAPVAEPTPEPPAA